MTRHTVVKGDSLWKIAQAHKISLDALLAANPQISDPNYILPGSIINVPEMWCVNNVPQPQDDYSAFPQCQENGSRPCIYQAEAGETLEIIANKFMIPLSQLIYFNLRYGKKEPLAAGSRVVIPDSNCQVRDLPASYNYQRNNGR